MEQVLEEQEHKSRINKILSLQRQNDIIAMLLEGKESKEIVSYLMRKYNINTHGSANSYVQQGREIIKNRERYQLDNLVTLHIARYDKIYAGLIDVGAYSLAANAMLAKETLMGFHREGFHMKVTQGEIQQLSLKNVDNEYDLTKLPKERQERLNQLLLKVKSK